MSRMLMRPRAGSPCHDQKSKAAMVKSMAALITGGTQCQPKPKFRLPPLHWANQILPVHMRSYT